MNIKQTTPRPGLGVVFQPYFDSLHFPQVQTSGWTHACVKARAYFATFTGSTGRRIGFPVPSQRAQITPFTFPVPPQTHFVTMAILPVQLLAPYQISTQKQNHLPRIRVRWLADCHALFFVFKRTTLFVVELGFRRFSPMRNGNSSLECVRVRNPLPLQALHGIQSHDQNGNHHRKVTLDVPPNPSHSSQRCVSFRSRYATIYSSLHDLPAQKYVTLTSF